MKYKLKMYPAFIDDLDSEQRKAVIESKGHSLIIAGPGSGKTTVITYKIAYLLSMGVKPSSILLLTFTKTAAAEMIERAKRVSKSELNGMFFGTFHHFGYVLLKKYSNTLNMHNGFSVIDSIDSKEIIKRCRKQVLVKEMVKEHFPNAGILQKIFSYSCNKLLDIKKSLSEFSSSYLKYNASIEKIYECYIREKEGRNLIDYDDLLTKSLILLNSYESIRLKESKRFEWILVDEFQDTNIVQYNIIKLLSQIHGNLILVGDDAQSIYSFRGVDLKNIQEFANSKNVNVFKIQTNYRSNDKIVNLINNSIPSKCIPKKLKSIKVSKNKPIVVEVSNNIHQAKFILQRIKELLSDKIRYSDIAILYRSHYQSLEVQFELQGSGIPYRIFSGIKFNETSHIKDLIAFMKVLTNPNDNLSWFRILKLFKGIGNKKAEKIFNYLLKNDFDIGNIIKAESLDNKLVSVMEKIKKLIDKKDSPSYFLKNLCNNFYFDYLEDKYENFKDRIMDVERFIEISERYEETDELIKDMLIDENIRKDGKRKNAVTLSTIHQSKGLEWEVVFLISVNPGEFPSYIALSKENIGEEERIFYVAITRAKNQLYIIRHKNLADYDAGYNQKDFIRKLPKDIYQKWEVELQ